MSFWSGGVEWQGAWERRISSHSYTNGWYLSIPRHWTGFGSRRSPLFDYPVGAGAIPLTQYTRLLYHMYDSGYRADGGEDVIHETD